jgi:hypothetical protein
MDLAKATLAVLNLPRTFAISWRKGGLCEDASEVDCELLAAFLELMNFGVISNDELA